MVKNKNESAIPRYNVLVLKRRGVTRDVSSGTESLKWVTNISTLIYCEYDVEKSLIGINSILQEA